MPSAARQSSIRRLLQRNDSGYVSHGRLDLKGGDDPSIQVTSFFAALSLSSLDRLRAPRLLLPRSGLERSDLVLWPDADLPQRQLLCRLLGVERTRYARSEAYRF